MTDQSFIKVALGILYYKAVVIAYEQSIRRQLNLFFVVPITVQKI